jgi:hypothetical protein
MQTYHNDGRGLVLLLSFIILKQSSKGQFVSPLEGAFCVRAIHAILLGKSSLEEEKTVSQILGSRLWEYLSLFLFTYGDSVALGR